MSTHTPGPWSIDSTRNEGEYGNRGPDTRSGFDSYVVIDADGLVLFDSVNSDAIEVEEEYDVDYFHAWDAVGKANMTLAAAAPNMLALLQMAQSGAFDSSPVAHAQWLALVDTAIAAATGTQPGTQQEGQP